MQFYGVRLKEARTKKGRTQEEMAEAIGVSQTSYQRMESGKHDMRMSNIIKICKELDISADWLLGLE